MGPEDFDLCYIHTGCDSASYCDQECCDANGGCYGGAPAWFCDDGQQLDGNTEFDPCEIHQGCASPSYAKWDGSKWVCSDTQPSTPIATQCSDLKDSCGPRGGCGNDAVFPDCIGLGSSCTPYSFMPNVDNANPPCDTWMNNGEFVSNPFFDDNNAYTWQAYQAPGAKDVWILHGCDGAGIQTDCAGDIFYLEHFASTQPVDGQDCPVGTYGSDHIQCPTFYHPGKGQSFPSYSCGWWRGYNWAKGIEEASADGVGAFGPAGAGGDYSDAMRAALRNCPSCRDGTGLKHPYYDAENVSAFFVGAVYPWICTRDNGSNPYTGSDANCYCDNEPWNGRGSGARDYPRTTQVVYCALYASDELNCDFIDMGDDGATATYRAVSMGRIFDF